MKHQTLSNFHPGKIPALTHRKWQNISSSVLLWQCLPALWKRIFFIKKGIFFRSLICKGRTFCTTSAVQVCGFGEEQFPSISKWEKDGSTAVRKKMLPHCQGSVPGSQVCPGAHSPLLSLLWRGLMGLLRGGNHWNAAVLWPTVKAVPKHRPNNADFYPARGESRLGSSLNSIPSRKCNLPYEICPWERTSNRIKRRGRINMEKAPMDGQNHYIFFCCLMPHLMNRAVPLWAGTHLPHLRQSVMEEWELRHKHSHQGWESLTANAMTTPFSFNYLHVGKGGAVNCCCTGGVFFL